MIEIEGLDFAYPHCGFRLRIDRFEVASRREGGGHRSPSGSGKTTLLNLLAGIAVPDRRQRCGWPGRTVGAHRATPREARLSHHAHRLRVPGLRADRVPLGTRQHPAPVPHLARRCASTADVRRARPRARGAARPRRQARDAASPTSRRASASAWRSAAPCLSHPKLATGGRGHGQPRPGQQAAHPRPAVLGGRTRSARAWYWPSRTTTRCCRASIERSTSPSSAVERPSEGELLHCRPLPGALPMAHGHARRLRDRHRRPAPDARGAAAGERAKSDVTGGRHAAPGRRARQRDGSGSEQPLFHARHPRDRADAPGRAAGGDGAHGRHSALRSLSCARTADRRHDARLFRLPRARVGRGAGVRDAGRVRPGCGGGPNARGPGRGDADLVAGNRFRPFWSLSTQDARRRCSSADRDSRRQGGLRRRPRRLGSSKASSTATRT